MRVRTTPPERADAHRSWHEFERGWCLWCGWHCADCPKDVATCKCKGADE